jgi:hypothetical protein
VIVYLHDLFEADDFSKAVNGLAAQFREKHNFPKIHQLGLVVSDVERAAEKLEAEGIAPFFIAAGSPVFWREGNEERDISGKLGIAYYKGFELELLEPTMGSDFYRQSLDPDGKIVVQHVGFLVDDVDAWAGRMVKEGLSVCIRGQLKAWPFKTDFAYMEPLEENHLILEFINWRLFGFSFGPPPGLLKTIGRIEKWTGKRSLKL